MDSGQPDNLTVSLLTVVFIDGSGGMARVFVDDEAGTSGAVGAVVEEFDGEGGPNAFEEFLSYVSACRVW